MAQMTRSITPERRVLSEDVDMVKCQVSGRMGILQGHTHSLPVSDRVSLHTAENFHYRRRFLKSKTSSSVLAEIAERPEEICPRGAFGREDIEKS